MPPSASSADTPAASTPFDALIGVADLRARLATPELCILDCRHDLADPESGLAQYRLAHIPGAVFAHLDRDLSGPRAPDGRTGRHPLPEPDALAARLRAWGVGSRTQVVAYDASQGCFAARAWWLLRWLGHERVAVLDGGWQAWLEAGGPTEAREPAPAAGDLRTGPSRQPIAALEFVEEAVRRRAAAPPVILDARAPDRYEGRNETLDPVGGHIPGAVNRFWKDNLDARGHFKAPARLRAEYQALLGGRAPQEAILQCGSGVTACHDLLALHVAGLPGASLFPGSWSQWVADPRRPVATGPQPG